jgi:hypothetical protein
MTDQQALIRAFADYARTLSARYDIGDVLYRLTDQVVEVLGVNGAGVSLAAQDGALPLVTAAEERIVSRKQQLDAGEGPCHDAILKCERVITNDLRAEGRWPSHTSVALETGCGRWQASPGWWTCSGSEPQMCAARSRARCRQHPLLVSSGVSFNTQPGVSNRVGAPRLG